MLVWHWTLPVCPHLLWEHYATLSREMAAIRAQGHVLVENVPQNEAGSPGQPKCPAIRGSNTGGGFGSERGAYSGDVVHRSCSHPHQRTTWHRTSGRHPSERVYGMLRNRWLACAGLCTDMAPTPSICSAGIFQQYLEGVHFTLHPSLHG
jgi:hypothetical protein